MDKFGNKVVSINRSLNTGEKTALELLYAKHNTALTNYLRRFRLSNGVIDDIVHDVFVRLIEKDVLTTLEEPPRSYLFKMAENIAIDMLRRERMVRLRNAEKSILEPSFNDLSPDVEADTQKSVEKLRNALQELPSKCRDVFLMHKVQGMTANEVANNMGISQRSVHRHSSQAMLYCMSRLDKQES